MRTSGWDGNNWADGGTEKVGNKTHYGGTGNSPDGNKMPVGRDETVGTDTEVGKWSGSRGREQNIHSGFPFPYCLGGVISKGFRLPIIVKSNKNVFSRYIGHYVNTPSSSTTVMLTCH